jgi:hydroxyacylglutathione hydrolase
MAEKLIHEIIPVGMLQCNCSILGDPVTREAIVVDPGDEVERIVEILRTNKLKVRAIVSTHTHIDHVGGLAVLHRATGAPVLIHEADLPMYQNLEAQARFLGTRTPESMKIEDFVKDGDALRWGDYSARVMHTPGHSPGSISLFVEKGATGSQEYLERGIVSPGAGLKTALRQSGPSAHAHTHGHLQRLGDDPARLIAGDTLFQGSIGRTDLWGGSMKDILNSLREKLMMLPDETVVIPGHGDLTTIGEERVHNPYLK